MSITKTDDQSKENHSARRDLYEAYANTSNKTRRSKKLIESLDEVYGYDIAFVIAVIMRAEFSGNLNIISQTNELSGISFSNGRITKIDSNDKETFLGELLIKEGFITRDKLLSILKDQTKPLGDTLISNNIVTKEQIVEILIKQMRLRLSKYISATKYRLNFSESTVEDFGLSISYNEYLGLAHDWIAGRFELDWLTLHYVEVRESYIEILPITSQSATSTISSLPLTRDLNRYLQQKTETMTLSELIEVVKNEKDQAYFYKCIHFGVMAGLIFLRENPNSNSNNDSILKNIYAVCSKKTGVELVETLANILKFKPTEIDAIFQSINSYVTQYSGEDQDMKNNMFRIVLEMLSKKQYYEEQMNKKYSQTENLQGQIDYSKKMDEIQKDLLNKNLYIAVDKLKKMSALNIAIPKLKLYLVWAKALMIHKNNIVINFADLDREFLQILPEDKDSAEFYYVKSILQFLKKDTDSADVNYDRAVKLKPDLKQYPPYEKKDSLLKKIFKFSVIFLASTLLFNNQSMGQTTVVKKIPFVYLNQYFSYSANSNGQFSINDQAMSFNDFELTQNQKKWTMKFSNYLGKMSENATFVIYSSEDNKNSTIKIKRLEDIYTFSWNAQPNQFICLTHNNQYTSMQFCKSFQLNQETKLKSVTANGLNIDPQGQIILTDAKQKAQFKIELLNNDFFSLTTSKRSVIPLQVSKQDNSEQIELQLLDQLDTTQGWKETININQNYFNIRFDNLITLKQGLYFDNRINTQVGFSETFIDKDKISKKYFNKLILEPIIVFEELKGKSSIVDGRINSDAGLGLSLTYDRHLSTGNNVNVSFGIYKTKMTPNLGNAITSEAEMMFMYALGGFKFPLSDKWNYSALLKLQEYSFFSLIGPKEVDITKSILASPGISTDYEFLNTSGWNLLGALKVYLSLPAEIRSTSKTELGYLASVELKTTYKVNWGRIVGAIEFENRSNKNDTYNYNSSMMTYRLGANYLF